MLKEFQAFISRGNVMDMAVGIIVGAAFTAIVQSLVTDIINPLIGLFTGGVDFTNNFLLLSEGGPYASLAEARDAPQGRPALAADDDRRMGPLHGLRVEKRAGEGEARSLVARDLLRPQGAHRLDGLVRARAAIVEGHAEGPELLLEPADADAEVDPSAGEVIEIRHHLRRVDRRALGHDADART